MRVLHVVATRQRRGAEVFASDLSAKLDELGVRQRVAVLRDGTFEVEFPVPTAVLSPGASQVSQQVSEFSRSVAHHPRLST